MRNDQIVTTDGTRTRDSTFEFSVQPTVDDRESCAEVTGGDGIHRMSGECSQTRPGAHHTITETYRWEVFKR